MQEEQLDSMILGNLEKVEGTFYYRLYEDQIFDLSLYNELAVAVASTSKLEMPLLSRSKIALHLWDLVWQIQFSISCHYNNQDAFKIGNSDDVDLNELSEKLYYLCNWFTNARTMDIEYVILEYKTK